MKLKIFIFLLFNLCIRCDTTAQSTDSMFIVTVECLSLAGDTSPFTVSQEKVHDFFKNGEKLLKSNLLML
ncbi:MAG: hypothetical protein LUE98_08400 [Tannerellaceae bacterium]|nr:hypothetical protein [Tannerellaceae bacterium]